MKLEEQVCNLQLSLKLRELGVKQDSFFHWIVDMLYLTAVQPIDEYKHNFASAFTVGELGEILRASITQGIGVHDYTPSWDKGLNSWEFPIDMGDKGIQAYWLDCETEADARAKMLIYIIENKFVEV